MRSKCLENNKQKLQLDIGLKKRLEEKDIWS